MSASDFTNSTYSKNYTPIYMYQTVKPKYVKKVKQMIIVNIRNRIIFYKQNHRQKNLFGSPLLFQEIFLRKK